MDYEPVNQTITLGPGSSFEEVTVTVLDDIFTESDEVVCVRIVLPKQSQITGVLLSSSDATNFTITDNDGT